MISAGATVVHHRYRIHSTGAKPYEAEGEVIATGPYARPDVLADQQRSGSVPAANAGRVAASAARVQIRVTRSGTHQRRK